jgi:hypothetical protein
MAQYHLTRRPHGTEEALTVLFCLVDDAYGLLNPEGVRRYEGLKRLSDSEVLTLTLALFQQLRGVESEHSFLRSIVCCCCPIIFLFSFIGRWVCYTPRLWQGWAGTSSR